MQNRVDRLKEHIIVAGAGSTGMHVIEELTALRTPYVVIDRDREIRNVAKAIPGGDQRERSPGKWQLHHVAGDQRHDDRLALAASQADVRGLAVSRDDQRVYCGGDNEVLWLDTGGVIRGRAKVDGLTTLRSVR